MDFSVIVSAIAGTRTGVRILARWHDVGFQDISRKIILTIATVCIIRGIYLLLPESGARSGLVSPRAVFPRTAFPHFRISAFPHFRMDCEALLITTVNTRPYVRQQCQSLRLLHRDSLAGPNQKDQQVNERPQLVVALQTDDKNGRVRHIAHQIAEFRHAQLHVIKLIQTGTDSKAGTCTTALPAKPHANEASWSNVRPNDEQTEAIPANAADKSSKPPIQSTPNL